MNVTAMPDWSLAVDRIEKLERQNSRLKRGGTAILILVVAVLLMGQASPKKVVEANGFLLLDANGNRRATLEMNNNQPRLALFDTDGKMRILLLNSDEYGPSLSMADSYGKARLGLDLYQDAPELMMRDGTGRPRIGIAVPPNLKPGFDLLDEEGRVFWSAH